MDKQLPERKATRLEGFDYNSVGAYFITICTEDRKQILSRIVGGDVPDAPQETVKLLPYGVIAERFIKQLDEFYDNITVDRYVIMPNHIHIMLFVSEQNGASRTSPPTRQHSAVPRFVSAFKRFCNKQYGKNIWQRSYYDHVIRDEADYDRHIKYIFENPIGWYYSIIK